MNTRRSANDTTPVAGARAVTFVSPAEAAARTGAAETGGRMVTLLRTTAPEALRDTADGVLVDLNALAGGRVEISSCGVTILERGRF